MLYVKVKTALDLVVFTWRIFHGNPSSVKIEAAFNSTGVS